MTLHNGLDEAFERARAERRGAVIPYVTAGYPEPAGFVDLAVAILDAGADALELGIPFSDPLLDGPSTQRSQQQAIEAGVTPAECLHHAAEVHARSDKPLLFMGAYNPILAYGITPFCREAAAAGVTGLIVPDVPIEEQGDLQTGTSAAGLHLIQLVSPTSTGERLRRVCAEGSGFIYCISVSGVTGARASVADTARPLVERVRACTTVPVAVGFGIGSPEAAREVAAFADGVVVGSALINLLTQAPGAERIGQAREFIAALRRAVEMSSQPDTAFPQA